jgi:hypothetical protein
MRPHRYGNGIRAIETANSNAAIPHSLPGPRTTAGGFYILPSGDPRPGIVRVVALHAADEHKTVRLGSVHADLVRERPWRSSRVRTMARWAAAERRIGLCAWAGRDRAGYRRPGMVQSAARAQG